MKPFCQYFRLVVFKRKNIPIHTEVKNGKFLIMGDSFGSMLAFGFDCSYSLSVYMAYNAAVPSIRNSGRWSF